MYTAPFVAWLQKKRDAGSMIGTLWHDPEECVRDFAAESVRPASRPFLPGLRRAAHSGASKARLAASVMEWGRHPS